MAIADIHQKMDQMIAENHGAKAAVDCAMHDLSAKALNIPLYRLLGGKCNERVAINRHIGIMAVQEAEKLAEQYTAQGYQHIKMKIGTTPEQDASRVLAVREIAGKTAKIRLDANCGYSYTDAVKLIRLLAHCDIEYYEQLLPQWNLKEMSQLRHAYGIRILIDEAANNVRDVVAYAEAGAADAFTLKLCKCGGLYHALRMAAVADAYQMGVVIASTYDTHIGCAHCLQLASALANVNAACDLTTFATQPSMAETCHQLEGMYLYAGAEPGIGVYTMKDFHM
jgi:L-alanine-DL-glutamate epimerase-like enolase superfamily enzyme